MNMKFDKLIKCADCPIRHRAVCSTCSDDELAKLEKIKVYKNFAPGDAIYSCGDDLAYVASVVSGTAMLNKTMEDGRTQMVGLLFPSDFIGSPGRKKIEFDVTAASYLTLCCFDIRPFETLVETTPHLSQRLMEIALDELDAARDWMLLLGRKTAREKTATFIEMLSRRMTKGSIFDESATNIPLLLTREEIANYLGLTLETVSRQLSAFRNEGIVHFTDRKHFEVCDTKGLHAATGGDALET